ncbi:MAG: cation:proton antiporter subunit C [Oscillospiraceae bacterium]|jgi:multicomponent Na+:H+ antiporter subunit C|nr:cation:proton antiporter subunit C [Oscillospiraceae bacterium]
MAGGLLNNYYDVVAVILFCIGFTTLFLNRNLVKKIIGLNIVDTSVYLFLAAKGYITGRAAPVIKDGVASAEAYINPIPAGLILTGIVISVSVTAFSLALILNLYKKYETLDLDEILRLAAAAKEDE